MLFSILGFLTTTTLPGQPWVNSQEAQESLAARAEEAQHNGDYRAAAQIYQEMLKARPDSAEVRANLGMMYHLLGEYAAAIREFRAALEENPRLFVPSLFLGLDLLQVEKPREAIPYLDRASAHLGLAATFYRAFLLDKALPELKTVLQLAPQNPEANFMMADILVLRHQFAEAEPYAKASLSGDASSRAKAHALLGKVFASQGRTLEAIAELKQALPDDPDGSFHYQIAMLYKRVGDESAASEALKQSEALRKNREKRGEETLRALQ